MLLDELQYAIELVFVEYMIGARNINHEHRRCQAQRSIAIDHSARIGDRNGFDNLYEELPDHSVSVSSSRADR